MSRIEALLKKAARPMLITSDVNVYYYSGFTGGDTFLLLADGFKGLFTDQRYTVQAKEEAPDFEIFDTNAFGHFCDKVKELGIRELGFEENALSAGRMARFASAAKLCPMQSVTDSFRKIKSEEEIRRIAAAQELSEAAFSYFLANAFHGMTEVEAAALIENYMRKNGARKTSFETIVASGARGAMPHALASGAVIEDGTLAVCDFGCVLDGYSSDMTRTVAFGKIGKKEEEVYALVRRANEAACAAAKSGMTGGELDRIARDILTEGGYGEYFTHSLGHGVGLEIHEAPAARTGSDEVLLPGMTVTIEPGVYLEGEFGVRIEDLIVLTEDGARNLNRITKELIYI